MADPRTPEGLMLFEVYEQNGNLLVVTSDLASVERLPSDIVVCRPWATASQPQPARATTAPGGVAARKQEAGE